MHCKYCGLSFPFAETRCSRCQSRLEADDPVMVLTAARLPDTGATAIAPQAPPPPPPGPKLAATNPHAVRTPRQPNGRQQDLFPPEESPKVVELPGRRQTGSETKRSPAKRKSNPNQFSFEFVAMPAPSQPLRREFDSAQSPFRVAPLPIRAMSAVFDAGVTGALLALFAATLHWFGLRVIGESLLRKEWWPYLAAAAPLISLTYALLWCMAGRDKLGIHAMGLVLVSFDGTPPTPAQRICRLLTGWLSLGAGGLGLCWALADQEQLTWHDHASQTFLTTRGGQE
jgi:uncharacterized RDD family membrane protein YckC